MQCFLIVLTWLIGQRSIQHLHGYAHLHEPGPTFPTAVRPFLAVNGEGSQSEKRDSSLQTAEAAAGPDADQAGVLLLSTTSSAAAVASTYSKPFAAGNSKITLGSEDEQDIVLDAGRVAEVVEAAKQQQESKQQGSGSSSGKTSVADGSQAAIDEHQDAESLAVSTTPHIVRKALLAPFSSTNPSTLQESTVVPQYLDMQLFSKHLHCKSFRSAMHSSPAFTNNQ